LLDSSHLAIWVASSRKLLDNTTFLIIVFRDQI
jgi:hypothetical protein